MPFDLDHIVVDSPLRLLHRTLSVRPLVFDGYDNTGAQSITGADATLNIDTARVNGDSDVFALASDVLTITDTGTYLFLARVTVGNGGDNEIEAWLEKCPSGGAYAKIDGTTCKILGRA